MYIFNYTNAEAYVRGDADKMEVQELGPYVYSEKVSKVDVRFYPNNTISYRVNIQKNPTTIIMYMNHLMDFVFSDF